MVETQEVELRVPGLLRLQHDLELGPLLAHEVSGALNDVVGLNGRRLKNIMSETTRVILQRMHTFKIYILNIHIYRDID